MADREDGDRRCGFSVFRSRQQGARSAVERRGGAAPVHPGARVLRKTRWLADRKASQRVRVAHAPDFLPGAPSLAGPENRDRRTLRLTNNKGGGALAPRFWVKGQKIRALTPVIPPCGAEP